MDVKLITCVAGNLTVDEVTKNTLNFVQAINKRNVVIAKGESKPIYRERDSSIQAHGKSGLGKVKFPRCEISTCKENAIEKMYDVLLKTKNHIDIILLGPHTNLAKLLIEHPEVKEKIGVVIVSGGLLSDRNYLGYNVAQDPESAKIVFESGVKTIICPSDLGHDAYLTPNEVELTRTTNKTGEMFEYMFRSYRDRHVKIGIATHDSCAIMCYSRPEMCKFENMYVHVRFIKKVGTGIIDFNRNHENPNMQVAVGIDVKKFKRHYFNLLKKMP